MLFFFEFWQWLWQVGKLFLGKAKADVFLNVSLRAICYLRNVMTCNWPVFHGQTSY